MKLDQAGRHFIEQNEGLRLHVYHDSGDVLTIGYGHTGKKVHLDMQITEEEADKLFSHDVEWAERAVNTYVTIEITQNQFNALVDFVFNLGANALHGSTLLRKLNAGDIVSAAGQFKLWCHVNHRVNNGVLARRKRNKELFLT